MTATDRRKRFAANYAANGGNGTQAYLDAGFVPSGDTHVARTNASRLLADAGVRELVADAHKSIEEQIGINRAKLLKTLLERGQRASDLEQMSPSIRALELVGKDLGMFIDRHEVKQETVTFTVSLGSPLGRGALSAPEPLPLLESPDSD